MKNYFIKLYVTHYDSKGNVIGVEKEISHAMDYAEAYEFVNKFRAEKKVFEVMQEIEDNEVIEVTHKF